MKTRRILAGIFLPVPIAAVVMILIGVLTRDTPLDEIVSSFVIYTIFGYFMMITPSALYSVIMEFFGSKFKSNIFIYLFLSVILSCLASIFGSFSMTQSDLHTNAEVTQASLYFVLYGTLTGLILGSILWRFHKIESKLPPPLPSKS